MCFLNEDYSHIRDCILRGKKRKKLLIYEKILNGNSNISYSDELQELIDCGLVIGNGKQFKVRNLIYKSIFNDKWIQDSLGKKQRNTTGNINNNGLTQSNKSNSILWVNTRVVKMIILFTILAGIGLFLFHLFKRIGNNSCNYLQSKTNKIEQQATTALNSFNSKLENEHQSLLNSLESGEYLKQLIKKRNTDNFNFEDYCTVQPILALRTILDGMNIKKIVSQGHAPIREIEFSNQGDYIAFGGEGNKLIAYNLSTHEEIPLANPDEDSFNNTITSLAFHPNKKIIAVAFKNQKIIFYNFSDETLNKIDTLNTNHNKEISKINFNSNGQKLLTVAKDGLAQVWNLSDPNFSRSQLAIEKPLRHGTYIEDATFYDEDKLIVTAGEVGLSGENEPVRFWNLLSEEEEIERKIITKHQNIKSISFHLENNYLATAGDNGVCLWNLSSPNLECLPLKNNKDTVGVVSFSHWKPFENMLATAGEGGIIQIWDISGERILYTFSSEDKRKIRDLSFAPNDYYLVTVEAKSKNNKVILWDLSKLDRRLNGSIPVGNKNSINLNNVYLSKSDDDRMRLLILKQNSSLDIWELESKTLESNSLSQQKIMKISVKPNNKKELAVLSKNKKLKLWNLSGGSFGNEYDIPFDKVKTIEYSKDGKRIAILEEGTQGYFINSGTTSNNIDPITLHEIGNQSISMNKDGSYIATLGQEGIVRLWEWTTSSQPLRYSYENIASSVKEVFFSPNGEYLVLRYKNNQVELRTKETNFGVSLEEFKNVSYYSFSSRENYLATARPSGNISEITLSNLSNKEIQPIAFKTDRKLAETNGNNILLLEINKKVKLIATAEQDNNIHIRDLKGRKLAVLKSDYGKIRDLKLSYRDGDTYLIAIEEDTQGKINVQYWDITQKLNLDILIENACKRLDERSLRQEDIDKFKELKLCTD